MIIVLLVLLSISLLQVSHAVSYSVWRAAADYLFLRSGLLLQAWTKLGNNFGMSKYFLGK